MLETILQFCLFYAYKIIEHQLSLDFFNDASVRGALGFKPPFPGLDYHQGM